MADRPLLERIARHLSEADADRWADRLADAASILALMKDADPAMREAGDMATWSAMVDAALAQRWSLVPGSTGSDPAAGADEEGEISLPPEAVGTDRADWIHLHHMQEHRA